MDKLKKNIEYKELIERIGFVYNRAKNNVISAVNVEMLNAYWEIGKHIVEYEQKGKRKADYGSKLLLNISKDLKLKHGKGFSRSNLSYMRQFYMKYPNRGCPKSQNKLSFRIRRQPEEKSEPETVNNISNCFYNIL